MRSNRQKRRVQFICAVILHIPIVAIAAYLLAKGVGPHVDVLIVGLVATVTATVVIVPYIGRLVDDGALRTSG